MVPKTMVKKETEVKESTKPIINRPQQSSKIITIIISLMVTFIFAYITFDYFVSKPKINQKITVVTARFDSLQTHLAIKLPEIEKALEKQQQEVKDLKQLTITRPKK